MSLTSCTKEKKLRDSFIGKVWVIDSIKSKSVDRIAKEKGSVASLRSWNNILKPIATGEFDIYKDQTPMFKEFKISNDTLYLKINYKKTFEPFSFQNVNEDTFKLKALSKNVDDYEYYITNLTDLFEGTVTNKNNLYKSIADQTWYPMEKWEMGEEVYNEYNPQYYIKEVALKISKDSLYYNNTTFPKGTKVKVTNGGLYFFDPINNSLNWVFNVKKDGNMLEVKENNTGQLSFKYKRIDKTLLKNKKDLPKRIRLNCSREIAYEMFKNWVQEEDDSFSYFDVKTIKSINSDGIECIYTFSILNRSKEFYDIYSKYKFNVYFLEDGMIRFKRVY